MVKYFRIQWTVMAPIHILWWKKMMKGLMVFCYSIAMQWVWLDLFSFQGFKVLFEYLLLSAYTLLPEPGLALKTTGGILDFFVFIGDTTTHVTQLYTSVIGRPVMPSFWSLGFQLCRYGYKNTDHVKKVLQRNLDNKVPVVSALIWC